MNGTNSRATTEQLEALAERARITISFEGQREERPPKGGTDRQTLLELANLAAERAVRLYGETHPRPTQVTQQQAAEMLGVSSKTVQRYLRFGSLKFNRCGPIPIEAVDAIRTAKW
jgi:predicted DNA-binding protein (UPF0251 family)